MYRGIPRYRSVEGVKRRKKGRGKGAAVLVSVFMGVLFLAFLLVLAFSVQVLAVPDQEVEAAVQVQTVNRIKTEHIMDNTIMEAEQDIRREIPLVVIDAGHGGDDGGCDRAGVFEKDINLSIALLVKGGLENLGYHVVMVREADVFLAKEDRVRIANEYQADIYVSIHQNSSEDESVNGIEVWHEAGDAGGESERLAKLILQQTLGSTGAAERELCSDEGLYVTRETNMPACLIETGFLTNGAERERLLTEEYRAQIAAGIVQGIEYYFHPKTMYLTFDDGPTAENTARILDILRERNIKATFFLVGENVRRNPDMARRIVAEGHTIGIHTDSHDYEKIYASVDSFLEDFETARQTVLEVTGVDTRLFRFPGGSINAYNKEVGEAIIQEMTSRNYIYYDWNASLEDATGQLEPEQLVANGIETTLGRRKVVMLAHDTVYNTGICLESLLDSLPEYEMRPLDETVEPIQF